MILTNEEMKLFDLYYAAIVSMGMFHPGAGRSNGYGAAAPTYTFDECASAAMTMIMVRRERLKESQDLQSNREFMKAQRFPLK